MKTLMTAEVISRDETAKRRYWTELYTDTSDRGRKFRWHQAFFHLFIFFQRYCIVVVLVVLWLRRDGLCSFLFTVPFSIHFSIFQQSTVLLLSIKQYWAVELTIRQSKQSVSFVRFTIKKSVLFTMVYISANGNVGGPKSLWRRVTDFFSGIISLVSLFFTTMTNPRALEQSSRRTVSDSFHQYESTYTESIRLTLSFSRCCEPLFCSCAHAITATYSSMSCWKWLIFHYIRWMLPVFTGWYRIPLRYFSNPRLLSAIKEDPIDFRILLLVILRVADRMVDRVLQGPTCEAYAI
jgi:hypothetical protein